MSSLMHQSIDSRGVGAGTPGNEPGMSRDSDFYFTFLSGDSVNLWKKLRKVSRESDSIVSPVGRE